MAREEVLRRRPCLYVLERLVRDLVSSIETGEGEGKPANVVFVTYNRVGEGLLEPRTTRGNLTLDTYTGLPMTTITMAELMSGEGPRSLALEQVTDFFNQISRELSRQILSLDKPTTFVVYAGEGEKFQLAVKFISKLSSLAQAVGKGALAKFYLLACNHDLALKARLTEPLYNSGLLETVVYQPGGACGGLTDLQTIAEAILR